MNVKSKNYMHAAGHATIYIPDYVHWSEDVRFGKYIQKSSDRINYNIYCPLSQVWHFRTQRVGQLWTGNLGNLLLIIVPAVCDETNSPFGDSSTCSTNGEAYASLSMAVYDISTIRSHILNNILMLVQIRPHTQTKSYMNLRCNMHPCSTLARKMHEK